MKELSCYVAKYQLLIIIIIITLVFFTDGRILLLSSLVILDESLRKYKLEIGLVKTLWHCPGVILPALHFVS